MVRPDPADRTARTCRYGFKRDLNTYLAATPGAPNHTLGEIIAFNNAFTPPMKYGQAIAIGAEALTSDRAHRRRALDARAIRCRTRVLEDAVRRHHLHDAVDIVAVERLVEAADDGERINRRKRHIESLSAAL